MSDTLDLIKESQIGYICEDYGFQKKSFTLEEILNLELIELKNIEIPIYVLEEDVLSKFKSIISGLYASEAEYKKWLKANDLNDDNHSKKLFLEDCDYSSLQKNAKELKSILINKISEKLGATKENINCVWLTTETEAFKRVGYLEEFKISDKHECLLDLNEDGVLIAYC